jgi:protein-histidine pros-kinase
MESGMGLRAKFNLVILAAFAVGFLVAAVVLYRVSVTNARTQVLANARIMMTAANAIRNYTASHLDPILPIERDGAFVAETVPAFAAQQNLKELQDAFAGYSYREAALNPTNPANRAQDWEADIIRMFRDQPAQQELSLERDTPSGPLLHLARPITVNTEACLPCHSTPAAAPPALIKSYGNANGFGWKLHETIGAQILSVPMALTLGLANAAYLTSLAILAVVLAIVFVVLNLLLHYLVLVPLKRVTAMADAVSLGAENVEVYVKPGNDEISLLSQAFNRMRESLRHAMEMIR